MTIKEWLEIIKYKITDGTSYQWNCYGPNARYIDSFIYDNYSSNIVFDTETQVVYEATTYDYANDRTYMIFNPDFVEAYKAELLSRGQTESDTQVIVLDVEEDFLEKTRAIVNGLPYDSRVMFNIELEKDSLFTLMKMAHDKDITLNHLLEEILKKAMIKD
jgi:hypothetical protein